MPPIQSLVCRERPSTAGEHLRFASAPPDTRLFFCLVLFSPDPNQLLGSHMQQTCAPPAPLLSVHTTSSTPADKALPWLHEAHNLCSCQTVTRGVTRFKLAALCGRTKHPPQGVGVEGQASVCLRIPRCSCFLGTPHGL